MWTTKDDGSFEANLSADIRLTKYLAQVFHE